MFERTTPRSVWNMRPKALLRRRDRARMPMSARAGAQSGDAAVRATIAGLSARPDAQSRHVYLQFDLSAPEANQRDRAVRLARGAAPQHGSCLQSLQLSSNTFEPGKDLEQTGHRASIGESHWRCLDAIAFKTACMARRSFRASRHDQFIRIRTTERPTAASGIANMPGAANDGIGFSMPLPERFGNGGRQLHIDKVPERATARRQRQLRTHCLARVPRRESTKRRRAMRDRLSAATQARRFGALRLTRLRARAKCLKSVQLDIGDSHGA